MVGRGNNLSLSNLCYSLHDNFSHPKGPTSPQSEHVSLVLDSFGVGQLAFHLNNDVIIIIIKDYFQVAPMVKVVCEVTSAHMP